MENQSELTNMTSGKQESRHGSRKAINLIMLIGGFGAGQGSIFLAQTLLISQGKLELLTKFGTSFSFAILALMLVEAGSITILARLVAKSAGTIGAEQKVWISYSETSAFRFTISIIVLLLIWLLCASSVLDEFSQRYAVYAAPAYLVWSVNAAGILDGLKLSGVSGVVGSIAYISSAIALIIVSNSVEIDAAKVLGAAFSIGYLLTVYFQILALRRFGWNVKFRRVSLKGCVAAAKSGSAMLGSSLPGQFYFRAQLIISNAFIGVTGTALFVYGSQVIAAIAQMIGFIRRVEFPTLVVALTKNRSSIVLTILREQRVGLLLALISFLVLLLVGLGGHFYQPEFLSGATLVLSAYSPTIFTSAIALTCVQGFAAIGRYQSITLVTISSAIVGVVASYYSTQHIGVYGFAISNIASNVVSVLLSIYLLSRIENK
ncbi:polysaccharide biosynthesis C-terminal domain-containing protein [Azoarcus sp. L1K30]|uniref:polysaccharide biosynthesis C-terminal domain-containing protein n=1 Tax=Azoarcus sp. L1K30 TaxID=2820277 RepID=UPI001B81FDB7|nr:polysaccharide biosynthesis C-terminal domain-containing protein [Azoarcus sp. L1K30]MBR0564504.1 polysaccharide biosynthesis C-terminal domain-containing protein [Azoarcus sp. L1K30]